MERIVIQNRQCTTWQVFMLAWFWMFAAAWIWNSLERESFANPPPAWNIDGIFYDNIAFNLAEGRGFVVDFEQDSWRKKYELGIQNPGPENSYRWVMQFQGSGPTTMRSPGYPYVLSLVYSIFDWRFEAARFAGLLFSSLGLASIVAWSYQNWGALIAACAALTIVIDYSIMQSAGLIASESLAILAFALAFVAFASVFEQPTIWRSVICGVTFSGLFLTRGNWNLGLLLILLFSVTFVSLSIRKFLEPMAGRHLAIILITAICLGIPWWIRNCQITEHFQPFGTAGASGMVAAYCDESLADFGNWNPAVFHRNQRQVFEGIDLDATPLAHREYLVGRSSFLTAKAWALFNWYRLPKLAVYRYLSHWGLFNGSVPIPFQLANVLWFVCGLAGCLFLSGSQRKLLCVVLALDALIVMLTWAHLGRYGIPIRPLLHVGCAISTIAIWKQIFWELQQMRMSQ